MKEKRMYKLILGILLFTNLSIFGEGTIEQVDISAYPTIQIHFKETQNKNIQNEPIEISETSKSLKRDIETVSILHYKSQRPIQLFISIQASTWDKNKISKQIAESILQNLSSDDKVGLHIYAKETIFFNLDMPIPEALERVASLNIASGNEMHHSVGFLVSQIPKPSLPTSIVIISPELITDKSDPNAILYKRSKEWNIPIHIIGMEERNSRILSSLTSGRFYSFDEPLASATFLNDLYHFRKRPAVLEYESEIDEIWELIPYKNVQIHLRIGNKTYTANYSANILTLILGKFSDVKFFYTFTFVLLLVALLISYSLKKRKEYIIRREFLKQQAEIKKSDLYFHENNTYKQETKPKIVSTRVLEKEEEEEEELEFNLGDNIDDYELTDTEAHLEPISKNTTVSPDLPKGESYTAAFLIQKEGPNPGRQFTIHKEEISIGSTPENDLVLWDNTISGKHAKIKRVENSYYIYDMVSDRGVYINGKKLLKPRPLYDFDEIRLGKTLLLFRGK
jgi:hypothetical protein